MPIACPAPALSDPPRPSRYGFCPSYQPKWIFCPWDKLHDICARPGWRNSHLRRARQRLAACLMCPHPMPPFAISLPSTIQSSSSSPYLCAREASFAAAHHGAAPSLPIHLSPCYSMHDGQNSIQRAYRLEVRLHLLELSSVVHYQKRPERRPRRGPAGSPISLDGSYSIGDSL